MRHTAFYKLPHKQTAPPHGQSPPPKFEKLQDLGDIKKKMRVTKSPSYKIRLAAQTQVNFNLVNLTN